MTTHSSLLHRAVTYGAIAGILLSSFPPPLLADPAAELAPVARSAEPPSLDEILAPPGGATLPGGAAAFGDAEIPGTIAIDEDGVRAATAADPVADPDMDVLTRGPVHEAYAETYNYDATPGLIVNKAPPAAIAEVPPEVRPEDADAIWVPGYFAWDEDKMDFIWISGCWRIPPPGRSWVPGYWSALDDGRHQWVSGFWNTTAEADLRYLPTPPTTLEIGASTPSPGDGYFWAPGYWGWQDTRYAWTPGFWSPCYDNWVWCPPRYNWTPRGCLFIGGRWDWRLPCRGQLFAPCYFPRPRLFCGTRFYSPRVCLNTNIFSMHFWVRPNYNHYYFGNYYGGGLAGRHCVPWHAYNFRRGCGDPLFSYYQARYRRDGIDYGKRRGDWHDHFVSNVHDRPAVNFREQVAQSRRDGDRDGDNFGRGGKPNLVATTLPAVLGDQKDREVKLTKSDFRTRADLASNRTQVEKLQGERRKFEKLASTDGPKVDLSKVGGPIGPPKIGGIGRPDGDDRPGRTLKLPEGVKLPTDKDVATKGRPGAEDKVSSTNTLRLSRPEGLESPRKAKGLDEKIKLSGPGGSPRNVLGLPGGNNEKPKLSNAAATTERIAPRVTEGFRGGEKPLKIERPKETRPITVGPRGGEGSGNPLRGFQSNAAGNNPPGGNSANVTATPKLEPKFEPKVEPRVLPGVNTAPRIDRTPREVNVPREIRTPKIDLTPKVDAAPKVNFAPKVNVAPKIDRPAFIPPAVQPRIAPQPRSISVPKVERSVNVPSFTPRSGGSSSAPKITREFSAPKVSTPSFRSNPAPRISSGGSSRSSAPKIERSSGGGGGGSKPSRNR